jgi:hypothetical protein
LWPRQLRPLTVGIHKIYFNHEALYHLLQAIVLWLFFWVSLSPSADADKGDCHANTPAVS